MPNQRKTVIHGISAVGAVRAAADVDFGKTTPDGVTIAFSGNDIEIESGQSSLLEDTARTLDRIEITINLLYSDLVNMKEVLGLPDTALTGDLSSGTPTEEVLTIAEATLGTREDALFVESPGPAGSRRWDFARTKLKAGLNIQHQKGGAVVLQGTWYVLRPTDGSDPVTITDAV